MKYQYSLISKEFNYPVSLIENDPTKLTLAFKDKLTEKDLVIIMSALKLKLIWDEWEKSFVTNEVVLLSNSQVVFYL